MSSSENNKRFLKDVQEMKNQGVEEREIAKKYGLSISQFRIAWAVAKRELRQV